MILPNNGKVVIIDDQPEDVKELIAALSKEKVPFVHYKEEDLSDLPETPLENVRLVFLDLELLTNTYQSVKNITSPIKSRLSRLMKPNTPYVLIIWSKKENLYKKALLDDFEGSFSEFKPIFTTSLPKANIIGKEGAIIKIKKELEGEIEKFKSFNAFLVWESIVNESSGKLTNNILSLYPPDTAWDDKTKFLLYKLALAYSGKAVNGFSDIQQLKNALYTLTLSLSENIETLIDKSLDNKFAGLVKNEIQEIDNFTYLINKLLLLSEGNDDVTQPGNLYFPLSSLDSKKNIIDTEYQKKLQNIPQISEDKREAAKLSIEKKHKENLTNLEGQLIKLQKSKNKITVSALIESAYENNILKHEILNTAIPVDLNITPLCDYAQEKAVLFRILPGVMIESKHKAQINHSAAYLYITDADFRINNINYFFLFDFRLLFSLEKELMKERIVKYRIKQQLLSDIQAKLGAHVIRSGVFYLQ